MTPPRATGRSGRLRLRRQLGTAQRAIELLDRKRRIVVDQLTQQSAYARRTGEEWARAASDAASWLARAAALDGQRGLAAGVPCTPALVTVAFTATMGVEFPVTTKLSFPSDPVRAGSSALSYATEAHRRAVTAAAAHAAALHAVAVLTHELSETRARQRAIENRWIPRLESALHALETQLDELDREENLRLHWAAGKPQGKRSGSPPLP